MAEAGRRATRTVRTIVSLYRLANRRWFLPAVSAFPMTDYLLPFLPNQMLLVVLSVLHPARWLAFASTFVLATGAGAFLTAAAVQEIGPALLDAALGGTPDATNASDILRAVDRYGLWALAALAMLPWPPWPPRVGVIVCALAGLPPFGIGAVVSFGRILPATGYAWIGAKLPHRLRRFRAIRSVLQEVEAARHRHLKRRSPSD